MSHGHELASGLAAAFVVALGAIFIVVLVAERRGWIGPAGRTVPLTTLLAGIAAALSLGAGAVHFAVVGEHFTEFPPYGVAFAALASFQVVWAVRFLRRPTRALAWLAVIVNAGVVVAWCCSRTIGLPFGPHAGDPEPIGPLDLVATGLELSLIVVVVIAIAGLRDRDARHARVRATTALADQGAVFVLVGLLVAGALALPSPGHGHAEGVDQEVPAGSPAHTAPPPRHPPDALRHDGGETHEPRASDERAEPRGPAASGEPPDADHTHAPAASEHGHEPGAADDTHAPAASEHDGSHHDEASPAPD